MVTITRDTYWLAKLSKLRVDRARGDPAPHKPLLLLALCDLAEQGALPHGALPLSPELAFRFYSYWSIVAGRRSRWPDVVILSAAKNPALGLLALDLGCPFRAARRSSKMPPTNPPKRRDWLGEKRDSGLAWPRHTTTLAPSPGIGSPPSLPVGCHPEPHVVIPSEARNPALSLLCPFPRQPQQRPVQWNRIIQERPLDIRSRATDDCGRLPNHRCSWAFCRIRTEPG
jgi:hypothetical protein